MATRRVKTSDEPQKEVEKIVEEVEDVPSLDHWRKFGCISVLACIPYLFIIEKTPWNLFVCFLISWNPFVRLMFPS